MEPSSGGRATEGIGTTHKSNNTRQPKQSWFILIDKPPALQRQRLHWSSPTRPRSPTKWQNRSQGCQSKTPRPPLHSLLLPILCWTTRTERQSSTPLKQRWLQIFADLDVNAHHRDDVLMHNFMRKLDINHFKTRPDTAASFKPSEHQQRQHTKHHPWQHSSAKHQQRASNNALHSSITCLFNGQTYHTTTTMAAAWLTQQKTSRGTIKHTTINQRIGIWHRRVYFPSLLSD